MQYSPVYEAIHHAVLSNLWSYTSCSSYEAIHHAVSFNFLSVSAITVWQLISTNTVPKPSLQSTLTVTEQVSHTHLGKYHNKHKHTFYISIARFPESRKENKTFWSCSEHYSKFLLRFLILQSSFLNSEPKYFKFYTLPKFHSLI